MDLRLCCRQQTKRSEARPLTCARCCLRGQRERSCSLAARIAVLLNPAHTTHRSSCKATAAAQHPQARLTSHLHLSSLQADGAWILRPSLSCHPLTDNDRHQLLFGSPGPCFMAAREKRPMSPDACIQRHVPSYRPFRSAILRRCQQWPSVFVRGQCPGKELRRSVRTTIRGGKDRPSWRAVGAMSAAEIAGKKRVMDLGCCSNRCEMLSATHVAPRLCARKRAIPAQSSLTSMRDTQLAVVSSGSPFAADIRLLIYIQFSAVELLLQSTDCSSSHRDQMSFFCVSAAPLK
ncbi:hypothetical protein B0J12DRAFT_403180 [Macrophomina phaseolina]|uniref:Uncharacterized protein n=1 Tax=Macrophomina phaseolina TaxID=35725 RepID=A0ABQ8GIH6_9PEZI|nr:hypothetical protein B0J12DRAFT_403180 [Macrophomina phaseolina]